MEVENKKWSEDYRERITKKHNWRIKDMKKFIDMYLEDPYKEVRMRVQICKLCQYQSVVVMQAFTYTNCGRCGTKISCHNSDIDLLCHDCAVETGSCKHCGGEMD